MSYKYVNEDDHSFTFELGGKHQKVSKHGLSKKTIKKFQSMKVQKLADGGYVGGDDAAAADSYADLADPQAMLNNQDLAYAESRGNPDAQSPYSSASGKYQITSGTRKSAAAQLKAQGINNPTDEDIKNHLIKQGDDWYTQKHGSAPDEATSYAVFQQGIHGYNKLENNPKAKAVSIVGKDAVKNNGGTEDMTAAQFKEVPKQYWKTQMEKLHGPQPGQQQDGSNQFMNSIVPDFSGGAYGQGMASQGQGQGPQVPLSLMPNAEYAKQIDTSVIPQKNYGYLNDSLENAGSFQPGVSQAFEQRPINPGRLFGPMDNKSNQSLANITAPYRNNDGVMNAPNVVPPAPAPSEYDQAMEDTKNAMAGKQAQQQGPQGPDYFGQANQLFEQGTGNQLGALDTQYKGVKQLADRENQIYNDYINQISPMAKDYQDAIKQYTEEDEKLRARVEQNPIDANRYWHNLDTGQKITSTIGLFLGGFGAALTHTPNFALQLFTNAIDRDVEAQRQNMGQTNNLMSQNYRRFGNIIQAQTATRAQLLAVTDAKLSQALAQAKTPEAMAAIQNAKGQIQMQRFQLLRNLGVQDVLNKVRGAYGQRGGITPAQEGYLVNIMSPEDKKTWQETKVQTGNMIYQAPTKEAASKMQELEPIHSQAMSLLTQLSDLASQNTVYDKMSGQTRAKADAIIGGLEGVMPMLTSATIGSKRIHADAEGLEKMISDPTRAKNIFKDNAGLKQVIMDSVKSIERQRVQNLQGYKSPILNMDK